MTSAAFVLAGLLGLAGPADPPAALSQDQRLQILTEAQAAYGRGIAQLRSSPQAAAAEFGTAATRYRQLVDDGVANGPLLYNLGNAYLQGGDPRLAHNLAYARSLRRDRLAESGTRQLAGALLAWHRGLSATARFAWFAVAWAVLWGTLLAGAITRRTAWRWIALGAAVASLALGASVALDLAAPPREGVVLGAEVIVRKGNGEGFAPQFEEPLHAGVEFRLLEERPGWCFIELANGSTGWIRQADAGLVG